MLRCVGAYLWLDLCPLGKPHSIFNINAEIPHGALDFGVAQQDLPGAQIARLLVDDGRLGPPQGVGFVFLPAQTNARDPFINERAYWRRG